jgi:hypothetical protein
MIRLLDTFFEYVAVRERRERLMMQLAIIAVAIAVVCTSSLVIYTSIR